MTLLELLPFAAVALAAWLLLFRPAKARRDAQAALVAALAPGVRIMTTAGVFGTVRAVDDDRMELEIAPGVVIEMVPQAVGRIVQEPGAEASRGADDATDQSDAAAPSSADGNPEVDRG
jgi:preprotein translocase subunit YajC